ncbi:hypothetical protein QOZ80_2AG0143990 [Eleusine coracana subsp. coracana]|nr:hypothetical protein QOZ80_2AG0143990 [Eleusine coracana subsp. coracana]
MSFPSGGAANNGSQQQQQQQAHPAAIREQDRLMPIANVIRIMRRVLPPHAKISDDAKETIQECVSEYISFITGEANERCQREQRKTITAEDVLWAMSRLGFDDYVEPLSIYLHRYRDLEGEARGASRGGGDHHNHHAIVKSSSRHHHHDMQTMQHMYGGAVPLQHHQGFAAPPPPTHQYLPYPYDTYGGEHATVAYYGAGGGPYGPVGNGGGDGSGGSASQAGASFEHQFAYK